MVTPSAVVRVKRWVALPTLTLLRAVVSVTPEIIGHAKAPDDDAIDPAAPPAEGEIPSDVVEVTRATFTRTCRAPSGAGVFAEASLMYPPAAPAAIATAAITTPRRTRRPPVRCRARATFAQPLCVCWSSAATAVLVDPRLSFADVPRSLSCSPKCIAVTSATHVGGFVTYLVRRLGPTRSSRRLWRATSTDRGLRSGCRPSHAGTARDVSPRRFDVTVRARLPRSREWTRRRFAFARSHRDP